MVNVCRTGKTDYPTENEAREAMQSIRVFNSNADFSGRDVPNLVYLCTYCLAWHLTHNGGRTWAKKKQGGWKTGGRR